MNKLNEALHKAPGSTRKYFVPLLALTAILIASCAPGTIPLVQTPTPGPSPAAMTCQGRQLDAPCDPRPFFEKYAQQGQFEEFAWDLFLYINWPAQTGVRGVPDPSKSLADRAMSTWESWKDLREAFPGNGTRPLPWDAPLPLPPSGFFSMDRIPQISGTTHWVTDTINLPPQPAWFGLRMNRAAFETILNNNLYNVQGQLAFVENKEAPQLNFPRDAMEVKSTWLVMNANVCNPTACPYHVTSRWGLTGLHMMSKVQENWFWATFEQVANGASTNAPQTMPPTPRAPLVNERMHQQLKGTVWENYILRGAQWDFVDAQGTPTLLSNTQIETRFQSSSSCMTCHALASRGAAGNGFLSFFQLNSRGVQGWVGSPPWQLYCKDGESIVPSGGVQARGEEFCKQHNKAYLYRSMDYVWALRLAFRAP